MTLVNTYDDTVEEINESQEEPEVRKEDQVEKSAFTMSFRDIEEAIRQYSGEDETYPVESWIDDFEDLAEMVQLNNLQKLIFAKKSLSGLAKLFIQGEHRVTSWDKLKLLLRDEFGSKVTSADIHSALSKRKMRKEESVFQYLLIMKAMAARGKVEAEALIQYVVDGIPEEPCKKLTLYEAKTIAELKNKLEIYAKVIKKTSAVTKNNSYEKHGNQNMSESHKFNVTSSVIPKCYNCGERGYVLSKCVKPRRERGSCYNCGSVEHFKSNCPKNYQESAINNRNHLVEQSEGNQLVPAYYLEIHLELGKVNAIIDTGSPISLICESVVTDKIKIEPYLETKEFKGVNGSKVEIRGKLNQKMLIDNHEINVQFYVVPINTMSQICLLGRDFIANPDLNVILTKNDVIVKYIEIEPDVKDEILNINTVEETESILNIKVNNDLKWKVKEELINTLKNCYVEPDKPKEPETKMELQIRIKTDHQPFYVNPRRLSILEKESVNEIVSDLLRREIIRPSSSNYCSPIVLVKKKCGKYRMAIDYRQLNKITHKENYPIPHIEDQINSLKDQRYFTKLDLKDAFHNVNIEPNSIQYTSFVTHLKQFEYLKMPFGLRNGSSMFMRYINQIFRPLLDQRKISIYLDDILIATKTVEDNIGVLKNVLELIVCNCLELRLDECEFYLTKIDYLGYKIKENEIRPNDDKIT